MNLNHDAVAVQACLDAGLNEEQTDALLARLKSDPTAATRPAGDLSPIPSTGSWLTTDDRALLERAASTYGAGQYPETGPWEYFFERAPLGEDGFKDWNPLVDDGDAYRLAQHMRMLVDFEEGEVNGMFAIRGTGIDRSAAMRRAIVLAAAGGLA